MLRLGTTSLVVVGGADWPRPGSAADRGAGAASTAPPPAALPADPLTVAEPCREDDAPKEADPEVPPEHPASSRLAPEIATAMPSAVARAPVREGKARTLVFMLVGRTRRAPGSGLGDNRPASALMRRIRSASQ
jgi:hypothetical protein